jgi:hypothetical protein
VVSARAVDINPIITSVAVRPILSLLLIIIWRPFDKKFIQQQNCKEQQIKSLLIDAYGFEDRKNLS